MDLKVPFVYYPTTVTVIDDSANYLENLVSELQEKYLITSFLSGKKALQGLDLSRIIMNTFENAVKLSDEYTDHIITDLDLSFIQKEMLNPDRFSLTKTFIIDYDMPDINGVELSKKLKQISKQVRIILLTGKAGLSEIIAAFNDGLIQCYIPKDKPNLVESLFIEIENIQRQYFIEACEKLVPSIRHTYEELITLLSDNKFSSFFNDMCKKNNIVEYYLLGFEGDFICFDLEGTPFLFSIRSEDAVLGYEVLLQGAKASHLTNVALQKIKDRSHIPVFLIDSSFALPPAEQWNDYLLPSQRVEFCGMNFYYLLQKDVKWDQRGEIACFYDSINKE